MKGCRWPRAVLGGVATLLVLASAAAAREQDAGPVVLVEKGRAVADLACPANGQAVYCLDADSGGVTAIDPGGPAKPRLVVGAAAADGPRPLAIACIDTNTLAAVCRTGTDWSLRTWRVRPDETVAFAAPLQEAEIGRAAATGGPVHLAVAQSREWLTVSGLPPPLPPLVRGAIARVRVGRMAAPGSAPPPVGPVVALAANPLDETVLLTSRSDGAAAALLSLHGRSGQPLLALACGLPKIRDAACCRGDGRLWVVGGDPAQPEFPEGLWRLDAAMQAGRQVIRPVCVARLAAPRAVACVSNTAVVVAHGDAGRTLVRFDVQPLAATADTAPGVGP